MCALNYKKTPFTLSSSHQKPNLFAVIVNTRLFYLWVEEKSDFSVGTFRKKKIEVIKNVFIQTVAVEQWLNEKKNTCKSI